MQRQFVEGHLTPEQIEDYVEHRMTEDEEFWAEEHLAECDECVGKVRSGLAFHALWASWTAKAHGEAFQRARVARALAQALQEAKEPGLRGRLERWLERFRAQCEAALRVVLGVPGERTRIAPGGLEALITPGSPLRSPSAWTPLLATRGVRGRAVSGHEIAVRSSTDMPVEVRLNEIERVLEVRGRALPLAMLVPEEEGCSPLLAYPQQEGDNQVLRFANVPAGSYLLVFEPAVERGETTP